MGGDEEGGVLWRRKVVLLVIGAAMEVAVNEGESWRARNQPRFDVRVGVRSSVINNNIQSRRIFAQTTSNGEMKNGRHFKTRRVRVIVW
jgi:hypothetical protein